MKWFGNDWEIQALRAEVADLRQELRELWCTVEIGETVGDHYSSLIRPIAPVPINKVVSGIVDHLGLEVRKERAKPETVTVTKREDGQAARP